MSPGSGSPQSAPSPLVLSCHCLCRSDEAFVNALLASLEEDPGDHLMDPLMLVPLRDPVVLSSGYVLDRETALYPDGRPRLHHCPFTRQPLEPRVYPLVFLAAQVKDWRVKQLQRAIQTAQELLQLERTELAMDGVCSCVWA